MLNCYVVDDELASVNIISDYINHTEGLHLLKASTNSNDVIEVLSGPIKPDITFLDIDMPEINGLELAGMINNHTSVIFITSYPQYAIKAFEEAAVDYLLKPVSYKRFLQSVAKVQNRLRSEGKDARKDGFFFIRGHYKGQLININCDELIYAESLHNYVKLYTSKGHHITYLTMKELEFKLTMENFVRIHKSMLINIKKIQSLDTNNVVMSDQKVIPIGRTYRSNLVRLLESKTFFSERKQQLF